MRAVALILGIAVAAVAVWFLVSSGTAARVEKLPDEGSASRPAAQPLPETAESRSLKPRAFVESEPAETAVAANVGSSVVRGRCVDAETKSPLADCSIRFSGFYTNREARDAYESVHGKVAWTNPPQQTTGEDGRFEFRFSPPPPFQFALSLGTPERVEISARWRKMEPATVVDLGDVAMERGTRLHGRVIDEAGVAQPNVTIGISGAGGGMGGSPRPRSSFQFTSDQAGAFELGERLAAGKYSLMVRGLAEILEPQILEVGPRPGEQAFDVKIRVAGAADLIEGLVVDEAGNPVANARFVREPYSPAMGMSNSTDKDGTFRIQRLKAESKEPIRVTASRDGFEPARTEGQVAWGTKDVKLVLRPGRAVVVVVRDGDEDKPLERYGVLCIPGSQCQGGQGMQSALRDRGVHEGGVLRMTGICRGRQVLIIEPEGPDWLPSAPVIFEMTDAGAPQQDVTVWRAITKIVRVRTAAGVPIAGSNLEILEGIGVRPIDTSTFAPSGTQSRAVEVSVVARGTTGPDGTAAMRAPSRARFVLRALGPDHAPVVQDVVFEPGRGEIEVVVPVGAKLTGMIAPPAILAQLALPESVERPPGRGDPGVFLRKAGAPSVRHPTGYKTVPLAADGGFKIDGIPPGSWDVMLQSWESYGGGGNAGSHSHLIATIELADGDEKKETYDLSGMLKGTVEGTVTLDGKPLEQVWVGLDGRTRGQGSSSEGKLAQGITTGAGGRFTATVWPATYRLVVQTSVAGQRLSQRLTMQDSETFTLAAGARVVRTFDLKSSVLKLEVVGSDGKTPVEGVAVGIESPAPSWPVSVPRTDALGRTEVQGLPAGEVAITVLPKRLGTADAVNEFFRTGKGPIDKEYLRVATVRITPPETVATVKLPPESGY